MVESGFDQSEVVSNINAFKNFLYSRHIFSLSFFQSPGIKVITKGQKRKGSLLCTQAHNNGWLFLLAHLF